VREAISRYSRNPIIGRIMKAIGRKVSFQYPEKHISGRLIDRAIVESNPDRKVKDVPYWDVVDLIEFKKEENPKWIRIGYYRVLKGDRLQWGSQTTIAEPVETWKRILIEAANQKPWFRDLLMSVAAELKK